MRKTLLSLLTASSLLASAASSQEPLELYPDLRGNNIVSFDIKISSENNAIIVHFNTDDDTFADTKYPYGVKDVGKDSIILTSPFLVGIDINRDQEDDEGEIFALKGITSEYLELEIDIREPYPVLKGDKILSIEVGPFPEKEGLFAFLVGFTDSFKLPPLISLPLKPSLKGSKYQIPLK